VAKKQVPDFREFDFQHDWLPLIGSMWMIKNIRLEVHCANVLLGMNARSLQQPRKQARG
jgi:hypothetical protein